MTDKITGPFERGSFRKGDRVEIHPALDLWMRGARFGQVERVMQNSLRVRLDALSHRTYSFGFDAIYAIID